MTAAPAAPAVVHGRTLNAHPLFFAQIEALASQVRALEARDPEGHTRKNVTCRLAAITKLAFEVIPQDPGRSEYRLRVTLGEACKHWFRARLFQQHRLFFRYHASSQVIVCAWVNDEDTGGRTKTPTTPPGCSAGCWGQGTRRTAEARCWSWLGPSPRGSSNRLRPGPAECRDGGDRMRTPTWPARDLSVSPGFF